MICSHCSNEIPDGIRFCPHCGAEQTEAAAHEGETASFDTATQTAYETACSARDLEAKKQSEATTLMIWGIVSLAVTWVVSSLVGFILACIARSKVREYEERYGFTEGKARLGQNLSKAAYIIGLITTIVLAVVLFLYVILFALYGIALSEMLGGF